MELDGRRGRYMVLVETNLLSNLLSRFVTINLPCKREDISPVWALA
jgi:hypothetical protein